MEQNAGSNSPREFHSDRTTKTPTYEPRIDLPRRKPTGNDDTPIGQQRRRLDRRGTSILTAHPAKFRWRARPFAAFARSAAGANTTNARGAFNYLGPDRRPAQRRPNPRSRQRQKCRFDQ